MDRRLVIIGLVAVFVLAPLAAWGSVGLYRTLTSSTTTTQGERSKDDLYKAIERNNNIVYGEDAARPELEIISFKRVEAQWYVLTVKQKDEENNQQKMLIADFYPQAEKMVVITRPGEGLVEFNISHLGVPYKVIDELNAQVGDS